MQTKTFAQTLALAGLLAFGCYAVAAETTSFKFSFAPGTTTNGAAVVAPTNSYSPETGYGFEPGAARAVRATGRFIFPSRCPKETIA